MKYFAQLLSLLAAFTLTASVCLAKNVTRMDYVYDPGALKPIDSSLKVAPGDLAPQFSLKSIRGKKVALEQFKGKKNVVLSFVPAAWTPVCSDQWPGYNIAESIFTKHDTVLLGISVDNVPTLYAWVQQMGSLWFNVLSDFWPHGNVAEQYGVLRSDGTADRALIFIDKKGVVRDTIVVDINVRPDLEELVAAIVSLDEG